MPTIPTPEQKRQKRRRELLTEQAQERQRAAQIFRTYGLTEQQFTALYMEQDGLCGICEVPLSEVHVDHCHQTGRVRGLLCRNCNIGLGFFQDSPRSLKRAINYLRR
jgi:hypothetical protein